MLSSRFANGVIKSSARLDYAGAQQIIDAEGENEGANITLVEKPFIGENFKDGQEWALVIKEYEVK